jgi:hypothetical protein
LLDALAEGLDIGAHKNRISVPQNQPAATRVLG